MMGEHKFKLSKSHALSNIGENNIKFSVPFFSKKNSRFHVRETDLGLVNPFDKIEQVCKGIHKIYSGGTFALYNNFPMMSLRYVNSIKAGLRKFSLTVKISRKRKGEIVE